MIRARRRAAPASPYWHLSGFYLCYFGAVGALLPYWPLYLDSIGLAASAIGTLSAIMLAARLVAPFACAVVADARGRHLGVARTAAGLAALAFGGVLAGDAFWWLAGVVAVFAFFWSAVLPGFEAVTLAHLGERSDRYTRIRVWGSVGFIAVVLGVGPIVEQRGAGVVPWVVLALMAGTIGACLVVPEAPGGRRRAAVAPIGAVLGRRPVRALLAACFLMQFSHGPYYVMFSIYLRELGYRGETIGVLWALGVIAEVVLFVFVARLLARFAPSMLLCAAFALTTARWVLTALFADLAAVIAVAQVLHAASFGLCHAVAIHLVNEEFRGGTRGRGQALYSSVSFGAGGAAGSIASGYAWEAWGATPTWLGAAAASAAGLLVAWRGLAPRRDG